jgi:chitinase
VKIQLKALVLLSAIISTPVFANQSIHFSPYADMTINTHWDSHYQDMEPMDLAEISDKSGIKSYHLAFITDAGNCSPAWGGQASFSVNEGWGSHLTDKLHAKNIDFTISLGGASGSDLSSACKNPDLITAYEQVIKKYQPQGLDFDIENGTANVANVMTALKQVQNDYPKIKISFTLAVLPEGLVDSGKELVKQAHAAGLKFSVNIMAMDYGPAYPNDMGEYAIQAAKNLRDFLKQLYPEKSDADLWQMIEVTPMIGVNDVNVEQFTLNNVDTLRQFAAQNNLSSLSMWSIARDNPCADKWASPTCSGNNLQTTPYEFSRRFLNE